MKNIYLRFIQIVSFEKIHQHKDLSPTAILLLNEIAVKDFEDQLSPPTQQQYTIT